MSERPLEIKAFPGIDRFDRGTLTPPNYFETLQNYHPKSLGELESLSGVEDVTLADLPGVDKIIHTAVHKDIGGAETLLAFFKPNNPGATDAAWGLDLVSSANFTTGGTGSNPQLRVVFYGPGGMFRFKTVSLTNVSFPLTFNIPGGLPSWVAQINIYLVDVVGSNQPLDVDNSGLIATASRRAGVFPASIVGMNPYQFTLTAAVNRVVPRLAKSTFESLGGTLVPGRTYYFGVSPHNVPGTANCNTNAYPRTALVYDPKATGLPVDTLPMATVLPVGTDSIRMKFFFPNTLVGANPLQAGGTGVNKLWVYAGTTPEDVAIAVPVPIDLALQSRTLIENGGTRLWSVSGWVNRDAVSFNTDSEIPIRFEQSGTLPTGLVNNGVYWIRAFNDPGGFLIRFAATKADMDAGIWIATGGGAGSSHILRNLNGTALIQHVPENTNNHVAMIKDSLTDPTRTLKGILLTGDADRLDGVCINQQFCPNAARFRDGADYDNNNTGFFANVLGCWALSSYPFSMATSRQLLSNFNDKGFSRTGLSIYGSVIGELYNNQPNIAPNPLWIPSDEILSTSQLTLRTYIANGDNSIYNTNGYVLKPGLNPSGRVRVPTSKYIYSFNTRLVCGGGVESFQNSRNQVYYSEPDLPFDWGTGVPSTFNVFTQQDINGFGGYSQNLTTDGFQQFLFISKKDGMFSWDGQPANGPQQLYYGFGMASSRSFIETDFGPIVVARDNIYALQGGKIQDIGDNVEPILKELSDQQLDRIVAVYHNKIVKIGYPSATNTELDREIWMELRTERGEMQRYFSGPHQLLSYSSQASTVIFGTARDLRFSSQGKRLYLRDSGASNNGADIAHSIVISRLSMETSHLWKLMTRIDLATLVTANTTFSLRFDFEDGSVAYVGSLVALLADTRQLNQHILRQRGRGRIIKLTISTTNNDPHSIFNISIWFEVFRRKVLRYQ